jgi:hypothetical protein
MTEDANQGGKSKLGNKLEHSVKFECYLQVIIYNGGGLVFGAISLVDEAREYWP